MRCTTPAAHFMPADGKPNHVLHRATDMPAGCSRRNFAADWLHTHMSTAAQALAEENSFWEGYEMGHNDSFWMVW